MKHVLCLLLSGGLVTLPGAAAAEGGSSGRVTRTVQGTYQAGPTPVTGCNTATGPWACLLVDTRATEVFFSATVSDVHRRPVLVNVYSQGGHVTTFCGRTRRPVAVAPDVQLEFDVGQGRAPFTPLLDCPQHVVKTTGTIRVTLYAQR